MQERPGVISVFCLPPNGTWAASKVEVEKTKKDVEKIPVQGWCKFTKRQGVFLRSDRNVELDIGQPSRIVLVVEKITRKEEPPIMPKKRLTTNGNVFKCSDSRWQSDIGIAYNWKFG